MAITDNDLNAAIITPAIKAVLEELNDGTATAAFINASQISLAEKAACIDVLNATATRASINSRKLDLPVKNVLFAIAGL